MKLKLYLRYIVRWWLMALVFFAFFVPFTFELVKQRWEIGEAVAQAKSIRLEHYRSSIFGGTDQIIASKDLAPEEFHRVLDAFPYCIDVGIPGNELKCVFNPHHRIIITDAAGNVTTIRVCFECDHTDITHGNQKFGEIKGTPFVWMSTLRRFFADEGMPNSPELYRPSYPSTPETIQAPATSK